MATSNIDIIISAKDQATKAIQSAQKSIQGIGESANKASQTIKDHGDTITKVGVVSGVVFGGIVAAIWGSVKASNDLQNSLVGLKSIAEGTGKDFNKSKQFIQDFTKDGLVSTSEAALALKNLFARGFSLDQSIALMNRFKDSAAFGRQSALGLGEAIAWAAEGLKNENSMLVDNAGVTKNVAKMWEEYAKAKGIKSTELTIEMKREAEFQWVMTETRFQVGDAAKLTTTLSGQQAKLSAQTLQLQQSIGSALSPALASMLAVLNPIVASVGQWIKDNPELTKTIIIVTASITGIIAVASVFALILPTITAGIGLLGTAFAAIPAIITGVIVVVKALGVALAFLAANPIGIILTVLAVLAGALLAVYKNWDTIRPMLLTMWENIKTSISATVEALGGYILGKFEAIKWAVGGAIDWLAKKAGEAKAFVDKILAASSKAWSSFTLQAALGLNNDFSSKIAWARADWGPVRSGSTYLVGERGPELFTPSRSGTIIPNGGGSNISLNINMWGVSVRNDQDIKRITDTIMEEITRKTQLWKQGIA